MFVVTVSLEVDPAHIAKFMTEMRANARASLELEPDCHQFDICQTVDYPHRIFLYEIYTCAEAFKVHLTQDHFLKFDAISKDWVISKQVLTFERIESTPSIVQSL